MKGRRCARAKASTAIGDASVLITLPIPIKNLFVIDVVSSRGPTSNVQRPEDPSLGDHSVHSPECSARTGHVLSECPHDTVCASSVSKDVDGSCAEGRHIRKCGSGKRNEAEGRRVSHQI